MTWTRPVAAAAAALAAVGISFVTAGNAGATPTFVSTPASSVYDSAGIAYVDQTALEPLTGNGYNTLVDCLAGKSRTALIPLNLKVIKAFAVTSRCAMNDDGTASAGSSVATVSLLGGLIVVKGIQSTCTYDGTNITVGSTAASLSIAHTVKYTMLNGHTFALNGVGVLALNYTYAQNGVGFTYPIVLYLDPVYVGGHQITPGQYLEVGGCEIDGFVQAP